MSQTNPEYIVLLYGHAQPLVFLYDSEFLYESESPSRFSDIVKEYWGMEGRINSLFMQYPGSLSSSFIMFFHSYSVFSLGT